MGVVLAAWSWKCVAGAALIVTLPEVPVLPPPVAVKVPVPLVPVYFIPSVVRPATPFEKSPAALRTLPPESPEMVPERVDVIVTLVVAALKPTTALA